jgi:hypothetical protein
VPARIHNSRTAHDALSGRRWVRNIRGGLSVQAILQYLRTWEVIWRDAPITINRMCSAGSGRVRANTRRRQPTKPSSYALLSSWKRSNFGRLKRRTNSGSSFGCCSMVGAGPQADSSDTDCQTTATAPSTTKKLKHLSTYSCIALTAEKSGLGSSAVMDGWRYYRRRSRRSSTGGFQ